MHNSISLLRFTVQLKNFYCIFSATNFSQAFFLFLSDDDFALMGKAEFIANWQPRFDDVAGTR